MAKMFTQSCGTLKFLIQTASPTPTQHAPFWLPTTTITTMVAN